MNQDQAELERLNEEYIAAFMQADVDWYERHLAPDFVCIESDATVLGKDEFRLEPLHRRLRAKRWRLEMCFSANHAAIHAGAGGLD